MVHCAHAQYSGALDRWRPLLQLNVCKTIIIMCIVSYELLKFSVSRTLTAGCGKIDVPNDTSVTEIYGLLVKYISIRAKRTEISRTSKFSCALVSSAVGLRLFAPARVVA